MGTPACLLLLSNIADVRNDLCVWQLLTQLIQRAGESLLLPSSNHHVALAGWQHVALEVRAQRYADGAHMADSTDMARASRLAS